MRDFYGLYGIFASTRYSFQNGAQRPTIASLVPKAEADAALQPWQAELARLDGEVKRIDGDCGEAEAFNSSAPVALAGRCREWERGMSPKCAWK
jgi:hypothetical protein